MRVLGLLVACLSVGPAVAGGPRVDLNQDVPRGDVLSPGWVNWRVPETASAELKLGDLTVTLRAAKLATGWWKPGFDHPARMASDGVVVPKRLELVIRGLTPGRHTLGTFHNALAAGAPARITVTSPGTTATVTPTTQATHDADTATAHVEFDGPEAVILFTADGDVVLNGFEIDRPDPGRRAGGPASRCRPTPTNTPRRTHC